jgi:hypothetical protein
MANLRGAWTVLIAAPRQLSQKRGLRFELNGSPMISLQYDFSVLLEIARLTLGGPLCRLAALTKINATAAKDATSTAPENA